MFRLLKERVKRHQEEQSQHHLPLQGLPMVPIPPQRSQYINDDNAYRVTQIFDENEDNRGIEKTRQSRSRQKRNHQNKRHQSGQRSRRSITEFEFFQFSKKVTLGILL